MNPFAFNLGFAALGHALYHLGQKLLPTQANPMVLLTGAYSVALLLSALAIPFFRSPGRLSLISAGTQTQRQQKRASHQRQIREQRKTGAKLHENVALRRENETPARIAVPELP